MATKNMIRKTTAKTESKIEEVVKEEPVVEVKEKEKKVFDQSEGVMCRSITQGGLFVDGPKTGMLYRFIDYGDKSEIEYRDLVALVRSKSSLVFHPYLIIEDEDFIAEFPQIVKFYDDQYSVKDLKAILKEEIPVMVDKINNLPSGAVESIRNIAATMITNGQIDSIKKITTLNQILGTEMDIADSLANV